MRLRKDIVSIKAKGDVSLHPAYLCPFCTGDNARCVEPPQRQLTGTTISIKIECPDCGEPWWIVLDLSQTVLLALRRNAP